MKEMEDLSRQMSHGCAATGETKNTHGNNDHIRIWSFHKERNYIMMMSLYRSHMHMHSEIPNSHAHTPACQKAGVRAKGQP